MRLVKYDDTVNRPLPFFLAMEDYFARSGGAEDYFFLWQVDPTVIIGRNQHIDREINVRYCREHGIDMVRRRSGGGAVFADRQNIMMSHITSATADVVTTFASYTGRVAATLRSLGLDAGDSARNDVTVLGRKVSGNAFYRTGNRYVVHGTMLYDADPEVMGAALTPSAAKLQSKGVSSVRSRITTIREHIPSLGLAEFKEHLQAGMCDGEPYMLTDSDIAEIETMAQAYRDPAWMAGNNPKATMEKNAYVTGVGHVCCHLSTAGSTLTGVELTGDFFTVGDLKPLLGRLSGIKFDRESAARALEGVDPARVIAGLDRDSFLDIIFNS